MQEYHYTESGLDTVWLRTAFASFEATGARAS